MEDSPYPPHYPGEFDLPSLPDEGWREELHGPGEVEVFETVNERYLGLGVPREESLKYVPVEFLDVVDEYAPVIPEDVPYFYVGLLLMRTLKASDPEVACLLQVPTGEKHPLPERPDVSWDRYYGAYRFPDDRYHIEQWQPKPPDWAEEQGVMISELPIEAT